MIDHRLSCKENGGIEFALRSNASNAHLRIVIFHVYNLRSISGLSPTVCFSGTFPNSELMSHHGLPDRFYKEGFTHLSLPRRYSEIVEPAKKICTSQSGCVSHIDEVCDRSQDRLAPRLRHRGI